MSMTPALNAIDLTAVPSSAPALTGVDLTATDTNAPPLNSIDLTSLSSFTPDLASIDFEDMGGGTPPPAAVYGSGAAVLSFEVSATAAGVAFGLGAALLTISADGAGSRPNAGAVEFPLLASGVGVHGFPGSGNASLSLSSTGAGYLDWLSLVPPIQLQEVYRLKITGAEAGLPDLYVGGISSWQATNQAGSRSVYVQAVIPDAEQVMSDITDRADGHLVIQKGYRLADGNTRYEDLIESRFDQLRPDRGGRGLTLVVSGYLSGKPVAGGFRKLTGVRSTSAPAGKRRVMCDVDMFLQPGMTVDALGDVFTADYINYYVNAFDKFCEVGQR